MNLTDIISIVDDGKPAVRDLYKIMTLAIHRIDRWGTPIEICKRFTSDPDVMKYTGGEIPYTFFITDTGEVHQALKLGDVGKHARRWNVPAIGIAVIGDFRREVPPAVQLAALTNLCFELITALGITPEEVRGHDELEGGSADPTKKCPGKNLSMDWLRVTLKEMATPDKRGIRLARAGFVL